MKIKNTGYFYYLKCLRSFRTEKKLDSHKEVCENKDFCNVIIRSDETKTLQSNPYQKSNKASFIIYADFEYILEMIDIFHQVFQCLHLEASKISLMYTGIKIA